MGLTATSDGISVQFVDNDGSVRGAPLYGAYAAVFGRPRAEVLAGAIAASKDEMQFAGSDDWLTLVAVADSQEKLERILNQTAVPRTAANTSGSSRRVQIELDIEGQRKSYRNRVTIGSGPIINLSGPKVDLVHLKVLPEGVELGKLGDDDRLVKEFRGNSITLQTE